MTTSVPHRIAPDRPLDDLVALARRYAAAPERWPVLPRFTAHHRWYHRLAAEDDHEAWLLTWLPGQHTDLHDHGHASGALVVLRGTVQEQVVVQAGTPTTRDTPIPQGGASAFGPHHVHRVGNVATSPAVSLHVYAPALTTMTRYQLTDTGLHILGVDQTGLNW
jgi:mannose-6-phosphate isomerase-like protein (cupin superfamily)